MQKTQKLLALNDLCKHCRSPKLQNFLRWLGEETADDPDFRTSHKGIAEHVGKMNAAQAKALVREARIYLATVSNRPARKAGIWIALPEDRPALVNPAVPRKGRIALTFNDGRLSPALELARNQLKGPARLWLNLIYARPINELVLLYDAPAICGNRKSKGLWAGSGEVKAAHLIGECLSQLVPRDPIQVQRWAEWGENELERKRLSILILGSAIAEPKMVQLRKRERWVGQQQFHFEPVGKRPRKSAYSTTQRAHMVYLRKGSLNEPKRTDKPFRYAAATAHRPAIDYGLISYFKDDHYEQTLVAMQGISTIGTLAAARMLCTEEGLKKLHEALRDKQVDPNKELPGFELLLTVQGNGSSTDITTVKDVVIHRDPERRLVQS